MSKYCSKVSQHQTFAVAVSLLPRYYASIPCLSLIDDEEIFAISPEDAWWPPTTIIDHSTNLSHCTFSRPRLHSWLPTSTRSFFMMVKNGRRTTAKARNQERKTEEKDSITKKPHKNTKLITKQSASSEAHEIVLNTDVNQVLSTASNSDEGSAAIRSVHNEVMVARTFNITPDEIPTHPILSNTDTELWVSSQLATEHQRATEAQIKYVDIKRAAFACTIRHFRGLTTDERRYAKLILAPINREVDTRANLVDRMTDGDWWKLDRVRPSKVNASTYTWTFDDWNKPSTLRKVANEIQKICQSQNVNACSGTRRFGPDSWCSACLDAGDARDERHRDADNVHPPVIHLAVSAQEIPFVCPQKIGERDCYRQIWCIIVKTHVQAACQARELTRR